MKGDPLPNGANVVRYASRSKVEIPGSAFVKRAQDVDGLSINWLEAFEGTVEQQLLEVRRVYRLDLRKSGRFFQLSVDAVKVHLNAHAPEIALAAIEDPLAAEEEKPADPSHALFTGLPDPESIEAERIGDLIAQCIISPPHPAMVGPVQ